MTTLKRLIVGRRPANSAHWFVAARARGMAVTTGDEPSAIFQAVNGAEGTYRTIGDFEFNETTWRWAVVLHSDANATDVSTILGAACSHIDHVATKDPAYGFDAIIWEPASNDDGDKIARARLCYRLDVDDLRKVEAEKAIRIPESLADMGETVTEGEVRS